jgi:hypothetical protein
MRRPGGRAGEAFPGGLVGEGLDPVGGHEACEVGVHLVPPFAVRHVGVGTTVRLKAHPTDAEDRLKTCVRRR